MDENMKQAVEIVKAQASVRNMTEEEISNMILTIANKIGGAEEKQMAQEQEATQQQPPVDPKKAIREKSVICLECGKSFKVLTKKHLASHGLTAEEYKAKWGYKKNQALVAKSLARERRKKMQEMELWKKREIKMPQRKKIGPEQGEEVAQAT